MSQYSGWKQGWTLGAGFEHALTEVISLKGEALYMDFGKRSYSFNDSATPPDFYAFQTRTDVWSARVGLNFKLGDFPPRGGHNDGCDRSACGYAPTK